MTKSPTAPNFMRRMFLALGFSGGLGVIGLLGSNREEDPVFYVRKKASLMNRRGSYEGTLLQTAVTSCLTR